MRRNGFSLPELLIVVTISSVVGLILVNFMVQSNGIFFEQNATINQGTSNNMAVEEIRNYSKMASSVAAGYPTTNPQYTSGANVLVLAIPSIDTSGNTIPNTYDYFVVTKDIQNSAILREMFFADTNSSRENFNKVLSTRLNSLKFNYLNSSGNVVSPTTATQINFVINQIERAGIADKQSSISAQVNLRND